MLSSWCIQFYVPPNTKQMANETTASSMLLLLLLLLLLLIASGSVAASQNAAESSEVLEFKHHNSIKEEQCDLFFGEWIYDPLAGKSYSGECEILTWKRFLGCKENGRPDDTYLHWRWKPYGCDLPPFDPQEFMTRMRNKSFGGIGDSLMGNQLQSLLCMLSKVEKPTVVSHTDRWSEKWNFPTYNFTVEFISSVMLLKVDSWENPDNLTIHLDVLDDTWTSKYHGFDYVLIGDGAWFDKTIYMVEGDTIVGCHGCSQPNSLPEFGKYYTFRIAISQALRFMSAASNDQKPRVVVFKTQSPNHFEHGRWNEGGFCNRTLPFSSIANIADVLTNYEDDKLMDAIIKQEFAKAVATSSSKTRFQLLDIYYLSLLRPDGHPNGYREKGKSNDCLHWCLPGVTDTWNEILMAMLWPDSMKESL